MTKLMKLTRLFIKVGTQEMKQHEYDEIRKLVDAWVFDKIYAETEEGRGFRDGQAIARMSIVRLLDTFDVEEQEG